MLVRLSSIDLAELIELLTESWRLNASARLVAEFDAGDMPEYGDR